MNSEQPHWQKTLRSELSESEHSWWATFLLSVFFGFVGADRLYLQQFGLGALKLFTIGGFMFWWALDVILLLTVQLRDGDGRKLVPPWQKSEHHHIKL